jgi:hypothetical protein
MIKDFLKKGLNVSILVFFVVCLKFGLAEKSSVPSHEGKDLTRAFLSPRAWFARQGKFPIWLSSSDLSRIGVPTVLEKLAEEAKLI